MLDYARWKYILVSGVLVVALFLALPNLFGEDYAIQLARKDKEPVTAEQLASIEQTVKQQGLNYKSIAIEKGNAMLRFAESADQLKARDIVKNEKVGLTKDYVNAMSYASRAPSWMAAINLKPMPLGLDLRGGLYLLYQVNVDGAVEQLLNTYTQDFQRSFKADGIEFTDINPIKVDADIPDGLRILLPANTDRDKVRASIRKN